MEVTKLLQLDFTETSSPYGEWDNWFFCPNSSLDNTVRPLSLGHNRFSRWLDSWGFQNWTWLWVWPKEKKKVGIIVTGSPPKIYSVPHPINHIVFADFMCLWWDAWSTNSWTLLIILNTVMLDPILNRANNYSNFLFDRVLDRVQGFIESAEPPPPHPPNSPWVPPPSPGIVAGFTWCEYAQALRVFTKQTLWTKWRMEVNKMTFHYLFPVAEAQNLNCELEQNSDLLGTVSRRATVLTQDYQNPLAQIQDKQAKCSWPKTSTESSSKHRNAQLRNGPVFRDEKTGEQSFHLTLSLLSKHIAVLSYVSHCDFLITTLSPPRVINFKFPLQPHQKYYIHSMENLAFYGLHR